MKTPNTLLKSALCALSMAMAVTATAKSDYDLGKPFGFCNRSSRTDASASAAYDITGGGTYSYPVEGVSNVVTLKSNGKDMASDIASAITKGDVVVLDGSNGDFIVSSIIYLKQLKNKTVLGINGARLCTQWSTTAEIRKALDDAGVPGMSTSDGGGTLPNGVSVKEQAEYETRRIIMNLTGDKNEKYRKSGVFFIQNCTNVIVRNVKFVGPGSIDVGGADLVSVYGSKHVWLDHCEFSDGQDGNCDITQKSDFVTVSWCTFSYTERSYMHQNTNLVGSSDSESKGYLNITFANNVWGHNCKARMPMARVGKIHMLNNYYDCHGNVSACINPRKNSEFLIEGNYFEDNVMKCFGQKDAVAYVWSKTNHARQSDIADKGSVEVPYAYSEMPVDKVKAEVGRYAGATLVTVADWGEGSHNMSAALKVMDYYLGRRSDLDTQLYDVNRDGIISMGDANAVAGY